jgi:predicted aspartyl protease
MMQGWVNQNCEAMLPIVVGHGNVPKQMVEALVDTGFSGFLSLPLYLNPEVLLRTFQWPLQVVS